jgi:two-component system sensor histidine kinase/response regulator
MKSEVTLLLIDDKQSNVFALEQLLEKEGRFFLTANTGKDGLKLALQQEVDLIILDVQMPEMNGFEVAQVLKSNKRTRDIPIIFASAEMKERHSIIQGFEEGAVDYLSKPLDPELTKAKVAVLLKIQMQKRELEDKNKSLEAADRRIKQLNEELKNNLLQLELANKELESFTYSVSHDLRAPIRALVGHATVLNEELGQSKNEEATNALTRIHYNSVKMNQMIDQLLKFSKLSRTDINKSEVDMAAMVKTVLQDTDKTAATKITIEEIHPASADAALISHVWTNLISNAIKYSGKNENPVVEIGSRKADQEIIYYVKDNGVGFDMQYAEKLFGVFQRLHKPTEFEGTGVGLAIVQRIVNRQGGRVWAEAKVNEGATFFFSLPA